MAKPPRLKINEKRHEVFLKGQRLNFTAGQLKILLALKKAKITLSRGQLLEHLSDGDEGLYKDPRTVDQQVHLLRQKIGRVARVEVIETVKGFGYKYIGS